MFMSFFGEMCFRFNHARKHRTFPWGARIVLSYMLFSSSSAATTRSRLPKLWAARQVDKHANIMLEWGGYIAFRGVYRQLTTGEMLACIPVRVELSTWSLILILENFKPNYKRNKIHARPGGSDQIAMARVFAYEWTQSTMFGDGGEAMVLNQHDVYKYMRWAHDVLTFCVVQTFAFGFWRHLRGIGLFMVLLLFNITCGNEFISKYLEVTYVHLYVYHLWSWTSSNYGTELKLQPERAYTAL